MECSHGFTSVTPRYHGRDMTRPLATFGLT